MEAPGDPACPLSVQKEENVPVVRPPGFMRTGRPPDLPGIQVLLQDPGQCDCSPLKELLTSWYLSAHSEAHCCKAIMVRVDF